MLARVVELLPDDVTITTYDLTAVRYAFDVVEQPDYYYYKSRFGSAQYSESYARWIAFCYAEDREFFLKARARYYEDHR
ncbi:MAG TPA: hypothetical protein VN776_00720 [Terracidiphilus sp.]|nr:hypothetical protein [Terracidiphilus sp.]